jgi:uncharacterized membrane protein YbhN (UPF0104 family)
MKRLLSIFISLIILGILYWKIDFAKLLPVFAASDPLWMTLSLGMVVPLTLSTAWRLQRLMPRAGLLGFAEANRLILAASVLNLVLPSKMGDIAKAWFMSLVVFEKACDMLSLLLWCVFGLLWVKISGAIALDAFALGGWLPEAGGEAVFWLAFAVVAGSLALGILLLGSKAFAGFFFSLAGRMAPGKIGSKFVALSASWNEMHAYFWESKARLAKVVLTSIGIWFLHLLQIWLFILALRATCPFIANLALSPLAILAGLLPLTFAGVGTRDAALVIFYAPYFAAPTGAALGLLCTARYILPAVGGLPFAGPYLTAARSMKKPDLRTATAPGT